MKRTLAFAASLLLLGACSSDGYTIRGKIAGLDNPYVYLLRYTGEVEVIDSAKVTKGDFVFRDFDEEGNEIVSIMFEMKNEADDSTHRKTNESHFKKLDADRRKKGCEYAVLVSLLEPDNELYAAGITDVSYRFEKMYVIRPQFFIPLAAQYSRPEEKNRNVGIVLSGLLTGILASRVVSGAVGEWLGWREMYVMATGLMTLSAIAAFRILPDTRPNFSGSYGALMRSLFTLLRQYPLLRLYSVRAAFAFGALLCFWASLAFKMAQAPFHAGSDIVGILGLCGIAGALTATVAGKYITRVGIHRFNCIGALLQFIAWALFLFGAESYASFVFGIVAIDIGMQCIQLSNQAPLFGLCPAASNRINTIFMSTYFAGGTLGTFLSGAAWAHFGWPGVVAAGALLSAASLSLTLLSGK